MADVVFDIETNGLTPDTIHCAVFDNVVVESQGQMKSIPEGVYYAHNGIGFDYPVLDHLYNWVPPRDSLRDTLVLSRLAEPSREGGHSLEAWGTTLAHPKVEHEDWSTYTPEMLHRCREDVSLTKEVLEVLRKELKGFSERSIELEHKVAWIVQQQMHNGWKLDERKCYDLLAKLKEKKFELEEKVHRTFKPQAKRIKVIVPKKKLDGSTSVVGLKYLGDDCLNLVGGTHTRIEFQEFNLGSRQQIAERLIALGWEPPKYTAPTKSHPDGQPIVDDTTLMGVTFPEGVLIAEYLTVQKRIAMGQSWIEAVEDDGRVRGYVNSNGAVTGRMTHSSPNVAQVPAKHSPYGVECRSVWTVPEGKVLVGCDASGLELRMLAHYMADEAYIREILEGDVHTANQRAAGLSTRDEAKTFIYAFLYGAGDAKIGSIVGGTKQDGARLKAKFLRNTPALKDLRDRVQQAARRGWLLGLDGRRIAVRSSHAALNTLLQGAGAVVMKQALVNLDSMARAQRLDSMFVGNIHDEMQSEVLRNHGDKFGKCAVFSIVKAGKDFNLRCPLAAEYKIGNNWSETH